MGNSRRSGAEAGASHAISARAARRAGRLSHDNVINMQARQSAPLVEGNDHDASSFCLATRAVVPAVQIESCAMSEHEHGRALTAETAALRPVSERVATLSYGIRRSSNPAVSVGPAQTLASRRKQEREARQSLATSPVGHRERFRRGSERPHLQATRINKDVPIRRQNYPISRKGPKFFHYRPCETTDVRIVVPLALRYRDWDLTCGEAFPITVFICRDCVRRLGFSQAAWCVREGNGRYADENDRCHKAVKPALIVRTPPALPSLAPKPPSGSSSGRQRSVSLFRATPSRPSR